MQAVLLAAGNSTRMHPFGQTHKSTFVMLGRPLIATTIDGLVAKGITEVLVVASKTNGVAECIEKLSFPIPVRVVFSEGARGAGETLLDVQNELSDKFFLVNAHQVGAEDHIEALQKGLSDEFVTVLLKKEEDLTYYGAVKLEGDLVIKLVEKPKDPENFDYRIVGIYGLNKKFIKILSGVEKHHYSLEDALSEYAGSGLVRGVVTSGDVVTLKYPFHLLGVLDFLLSRLKSSIDSNAEVAVSAKLEGEVVVEAGAKILENAVVRGPAYIGKNSFVGNNVVLRGGVSLEEGTVVGTNTEVKHTVIGVGSSIHSGFLGDSVVGDGAKIAAFFVSGNVRLDRKNVSVVVKDEPVDSLRRDLGVMIGRNARLGIRVSTMPGVIIGKDAVIGPQTVVFKNIKDGVTFYNEYARSVIKDSDDQVQDLTEKVVLFDIDYTLFNTKTFKDSELTEFILYDEVVETLETLGATVRLGIFSEGDLDFQKTKLVKTMIDARFPLEDTHIVESKKATVGDVIARYNKQKLILVDDKLEVLAQAKQISPNVFTIWVKRGPFALSTLSDFKPDKTVETLSEVIGIITASI